MLTFRIIYQLRNKPRKGQMIELNVGNFSSLFQEQNYHYFSKLKSKIISTLFKIKNYIFIQLVIILLLTGFKTH